MTTEATKPANVQWWNQVDSAGATRYSNFVSSFPGISSVDAGVNNADANKWNSVIVFQNKATYDAFVTACKTNADWAARKAYNDANGIVATFAFTGA
jgi:hypothetical protein